MDIWRDCRTVNGAREHISLIDKLRDAYREGSNICKRALSQWVSAGWRGMPTQLTERLTDVPKTISWSVITQARRQPRLMGGGGRD